MTIFLIVFTAFIYLSIFWLIPSDETSFEKERREMYERWDRQRRRDREIGYQLHEYEIRNGIDIDNNPFKKLDI